MNKLEIYAPNPLGRIPQTVKGIALGTSDLAAAAARPAIERTPQLKQDDEVLLAAANKYRR